MSPHPWRYRCPKGHSYYHTRSTRSKLYCPSCGQEYDHKVDAKTGQRIPA